MKTINKILLLLLVLASVALPVNAQSTVDVEAAEADSVQDETSRYGVKLIARSYGDSIVIRWAPIDAGVWMASAKYGWNLWRGSTDDKDTAYFVDGNGDTVPFYALNNGLPIMPYTLEEMQNRFDSTNRYAGAAAQALYGTMHNHIDDADQTDNAEFFSMAFKQYQEQTQRQFMAYLAAECDPNVASALGLRIVDKNVKRGILYQYTLNSLIPTDFIDIPGVSIMVACAPFHRSEDEMMPEVRITQIDAHRAIVRWDKNQLAGYYIERSDDNGRTWVRLNIEAPVWPMDPDDATRQSLGDSIANWMESEVLFIDSLDLTKTYRFRVQAFDAFGERLDWRESDNFKLMDIIPPAQPVLDVVIPEENRYCNLRWDVGNVDPDLKGYVVTFAHTLSGPWTNVSGLLGRDVRSYKDTLAYRRGRGYYRVFASDTAGNVSYSASMLNFIEDVFPPEPPTGFGAVTDDTTGLVYMQWNKNTERDLLAYKVYFANQRDHEFIELSRGYIQDTFFVDSVDLSMLSNFAYYYVIAVDNNHNYSLPSDTLEVRLPDLIPPGVCILESLVHDADSVTIRWRRSVSEDVQYYYVYRKYRDAVQWNHVATIAPTDLGRDSMLWFIDKPEPSRNAYSYAIEAVDYAGNSSGMSGYAVVLVEESNIVSIPIKLKGSYNSKSKAPELKWEYSYDGKKDYYGVVYRSVSGGEWKDVGTFKRGETSYIDHTAPSSSTVSYYIELQLGRGKHSTPSNNVSVKTK